MTITVETPFGAMGWICTFAHFMAENSLLRGYLKYKLACESQSCLVEVQVGSTWLASPLQRLFVPNVLVARQDHSCMVGVTKCYLGNFRDFSIVVWSGLRNTSQALFEHIAPSLSTPWLELVAPVGRL